MVGNVQWQARIWISRLHIGSSPGPTEKTQVSLWNTAPRVPVPGLQVSESLPRSHMVVAYCTGDCALEGMGLEQKTVDRVSLRPRRAVQVSLGLTVSNSQSSSAGCSGLLTQVL